jgi:hypothetical protein
MPRTRATTAAILERSSASTRSMAIRAPANKAASAA